jgi:predicted metal-dependent phosphoesterase TrpH
MTIRIDMHTHTEYSRDSRTPLREFADAAAAAGLNVVCVTDHDTIDGALRLREMDVPIRVVVGEEIYSRDGEIIGLFLERAVPPGLSAEETIGQIHDQGGLAYVPHPFSRNRLRHVRLSTLERIVPDIDAVEVFNAREAFAGDNRRALAFATKHGLPGGVGSDAHRITELGRAYMAIPDFSTPTELLVSLRSGEVTGALAGVRAHLRTRYDIVRKWFRRQLTRA